MELKEYDKEKTKKEIAKMDYKHYEYIIIDIIILSEIVTSIFIICKYYSHDFDTFDEKSKRFVQTLIEFLYLMVENNFDNLKAKIKEWNQGLMAVKEYTKISDAAKEIVNLLTQLMNM